MKWSANDGGIPKPIYAMFDLPINNNEIEIEKQAREKKIPNIRTEALRSGNKA